MHEVLLGAIYFYFFKITLENYQRNLIQKSTVFTTSVSDNTSVFDHFCAKISLRKKHVEEKTGTPKGNDEIFAFYPPFLFSIF